MPENTKVNTRWAVRNFDDWVASYNLQHREEPCPDGILLCDDASELSRWLQKYILSTRKKTGEKYPPRTIHLLLSGLQRHMREKKEKSFDIFSREAVAFKQLMSMCDNYYRELREAGVGAASKPTEVLTDADVESLWSSGSFSLSTPQGLLNAVFFCNGKNFLLRGGAEHRSLKLSQVCKNVSPEGRVRYTYTENTSKNQGGGLLQLDVSHKIVHQFENSDLGERCHVFLLDKYLAKLPESAIEQDIFYLRPLAKITKEENVPWFSSVPVGKNALSKMVQEMCSKANIQGKKTNHSLRASGITQMFQAGLPEKVIQDRSGHCSLDGLRKYERVSEEQQAEACKVLAPYFPSDKENATHTFNQNTSVHHFKQQHQPTCSFSGAVLQNCTINVFNGPQHSDD